MCYIRHKTARHLTILLLIFFLLRSCFYTLYPSPDALCNALSDEQALKLMRKYHIPNIAWAIVKEGKVVTIRFCGKREADSIFQLGSISKTLTAYGILQLVHQNKINLDKPIEQYLTKWKIPICDYNSIKVTTRRILNHTGGLSVPSYSGYDLESPLPDLIASLNGHQTRHEKLTLCQEPGKHFIYSGGGYTLLQLLIEEVTGRNFEQYMTEAVFKPFSMKHSFFSRVQKKEENFCKPHGIWGEELKSVQFIEHAAAGLYSTIGDMTNFLTHLLSPSSQAYDTLQQMIASKENGYGLGIEVEFLKPNIPLAFHLGANPGFRSGIFLIPSQQAGLIILTDSYQGVHFINEWARQWIREETGELSNVHNELQNYGIILQLVSIGIFFIIGCIICQIGYEWVTQQRVFALKGKKTIFKVLLSIFCCLGWWILFYTPWIHPLRWVISAFLPYSFISVTFGITGFACMSILMVILPRSDKCRDSKFLLYP